MIFELNLDHSKLENQDFAWKNLESWFFELILGLLSQSWTLRPQGFKINSKIKIYHRGKSRLRFKNLDFWIKSWQFVARKSRLRFKNLEILIFELILGLLSQNWTLRPKASKWIPQSRFTTGENQDCALKILIFELNLDNSWLENQDCALKILNLDFFN